MTIDYGPAVIRTRRGELQTWGGAAEIEIGDRVDPARSTKTRGAERADAVKKTYGAMHPLWRAAERFRDDYALKEGANDGSGPLGVQSGFSPSNYGPGDAQIDAIGRYREATQAMGPTGDAIMPCLTEQYSIWKLTQEVHISAATAKIWLHNALTRLDAHYQAIDAKTPLDKQKRFGV